MVEKAMEGAKTWGIYVLLVVVSLSATFFGIQWQQTEAEVAGIQKLVNTIETDFETDIFRLDQAHEADIARLDESNRTRRNDIAELEARIAVLEERTTGD